MIRLAANCAKKGCCCKRAEFEISKCKCNSESCLAQIFMLLVVFSCVVLVEPTMSIDAARVPLAS